MFVNWGFATIFLKLNLCAPLERAGEKKTRYAPSQIDNKQAVTMNVTVWIIKMETANITTLSSPRKYTYMQLQNILIVNTTLNICSRQFFLLLLLVATTILVSGAERIRFFPHLPTCLLRY